MTRWMWRAPSVDAIAATGLRSRSPYTVTAAGRERTPITMISPATSRTRLLALNTLPVLIVGIVVLDLGIQATQILNQSAIYRLRPEARSRLTTAYLTAYFGGAVSGSAGASLAWERGGWTAVCGAGGAVAAAGFLLSLRRS